MVDKPDHETINNIKTMKLCEKTLNNVIEYVEALNNACEDLKYQFYRFMHFCERCENYSDVSGKRADGSQSSGDSCVFICYYREALKPFCNVEKISEDLKSYISHEKIVLNVNRRFQVVSTIQ